MSSNPPNALVPVPKISAPALRDEAKTSPLQLVGEHIRLNNREEVKSYLPDILGKALARIWIDSRFHAEFSRDPQATLAANGVHLPENMSIEFQKSESNRPRIVVYEKRPNSKFKMRVFYLQLVMMAGR